MATKSDQFLADIARPHKVKNLTYQDGLRFGLGFAVGNLLILLMLGALTWGIIYALHLH